MGFIHEEELRRPVSTAISVPFERERGYEARARDSVFQTALISRVALIAPL
jgi:hypothetical protein